MAMLHSIAPMLFISLLIQLQSCINSKPYAWRSGRFYSKSVSYRGIVDSGQFIPQNTVNVGVIGSTNDKISVIPGDAYCEVNVRCFSVAEQERLDREIKALADKAVVAGTKVEITGGMLQDRWRKRRRSRRWLMFTAGSSGMNLVVMLLNGSPVD